MAIAFRPQPVVSLLVSPQGGVHLALVAGSLRPEPVQDIRIDRQCDLSLALNRLQAFADAGLREFFRRNFGDIGEVDLLVQYSIDPIPVSLRWLRSSSVLHDASPFVLS